MNNDDKKVKLSDNEVSTVTNISSPLLSFPGSMSPTLIDKRTLPLLYVQSSSVSKTSNCNNNNNNNGNNINNNESLSESPGTFNVTKLPTPSTLSPNGTTKFVQVQSPNQNIAYVGTLFKSSSTGKDIIPQKVLLTPVKGKDVPMARYILPRPSVTSPQANVSPAAKKICRSFVVSPVSQNTLMTSTITVKAAEGTSKIIQPNIIRQRGIEAKVLAPGTIVPGGIIVPNKASVPPPGLTLLKSASAQPHCGEKPPMKVVLLDMKDNHEKKTTELTHASEHISSDMPDKIEEAVDGSVSSSDVSEPVLGTPLENDEKVKSSPKPPEVDMDIPELNLKSENIELIENENAIKAKESPKSEDSMTHRPSNSADPVLIAKPVVNESTSAKHCASPDPVQEPTPNIDLSEVASTKEIQEPTSAIAALRLPLPSLIAKEHMSASTIREIVSTPQPLPTSGERARKRKGSLSTSVSSPSKALFLGDNYENMKLFPGAEDIDPMKVIDWDELGVGKLPESDIKVVLNDFNMLELYDSEKSSENNKDGSNQKKDQVDEIFCCVNCGCYGLISEFFNENYCSISCRDELIAQQYAIISKKESELEVPDLNKDKKKLIPESCLKKLPVLTETNKSLSKSSTKTNHSTDDSADKIYEQDIVEVEESSSTEPESPPKKSSNDDARMNKVKKIISKGYKLAGRKKIEEKPLKCNPSSNEINENKSKIKLRPRTAGKISKVLVIEENIAQDLDVGVHSIPDKNECNKKSSFRWTTYLAETKTSPAWVKLFNNPYPSKPNRFKVGQKLEAIDPEHQSYFCLVTVADVKGYRLKLHFDGFPPEYDFWVNADCPNLFPSEFCNNHKIPLHPPPGIPMKTFDWNSYLARHNARAAPPSCFENSISSSTQANLFKVDMKLEAVDRKNTFLVCVSTVAAVMENRILIHFDSWGDMYDYWVDISSPYIRPVGWCQNNNHELTPPNGIKSENFSWKKYLRDTKSIAAPEKAFTLRPPIEFKKGMKIEAVDKRAPHLIRVATIAEVLPYQVKISFDGFPPHFGYWVDDDSPDIHPVGWASRAGHPLERPPTVEDFESVKCPTPGCIGQGYLQGTKQETHSEAKNCPYATENLGKDTAPTDRLKWLNSRLKRNGNVDNADEESEEESDEDIESIRWSWLKIRQDNKKSNERVKEEETKHKNECTTGDSVSDPEEIRKIFGPPSPIPIEEIQEKEGSEEIKSEIDSTDYEPPSCFETEKLDTVKTEVDSDLGIDSVQVKEEFQETCGKTVANEGINKSSSPIENKTKNDLNEEKNINENNNVEVKNENRTECEINDESVTVKFEDTKNSVTPVQIQKKNQLLKSCALSNGGSNFDIKIEKIDIDDLDFGEKNKLEEKNALFWSIHQVSQFTRPLISCADDCFLKEGIDGPGFLMLSKNDLLDYLGLSDTDAERVFRKISMLRQKVI